MAITKEHNMITKLKHHDKCPVEVKINPKGSTHYASLRCTQHQAHIQWLNRQQAHNVKEMCDVR